MHVDWLCRISRSSESRTKSSLKFPLLHPRCNKETKWDGRYKCFRGRRSPPLYFRIILQNPVHFTLHKEQKTQEMIICFIYKCSCLNLLTTFPLSEKKKKIKQVLFRQMVFNIFGQICNYLNCFSLLEPKGIDRDMVTMVDKRNKMMQEQVKTIL